MSEKEALAASNIVVAGVPSKAFKLDPAGIRPDAVCVNFSQFANFGDGIERRVDKYVPAIGKVTIGMLERNLLRLHANFRTLKIPPTNFDGTQWTAGSAGDAGSNSAALALGIGIGMGVIGVAAALTAAVALARAR